VISLAWCGQYMYLYQTFYVIFFFSYKLRWYRDGQLLTSTGLQCLSLQVFHTSTVFDVGDILSGSYGTLPFSSLSIMWLSDLDLWPLHLKSAESVTT